MHVCDVFPTEDVSLGNSSKISQKTEGVVNMSEYRRFPGLGKIADFVPVVGAPLEKYGDDYESPDVLSVCYRLRAQDPYLFRKRGTKDIAKVIMNNLRKSEMLQEVSLRGGHLVSFKLSWEWMAKRIQNMLDDGDMNLNMHADVFRSQYIRDMLVRMFEYSRVHVSSTYVNHHGSSRKPVFDENMVEKFFLVEKGEFKERGKHGDPLFVGEAGERGYINVDIDLQDYGPILAVLFHSFWLSILELAAIAAATQGNCGSLDRCTFIFLVLTMLKKSITVLHYDVSFIFYGMLKIFRPVVGEVVREMSINELKDEYRKTSSLEKAHGG
nr:arginine--tRNA ligase, cytoplasmic isoform X1 [Tanacetum cinerariifolium]